MGLLLLTKHTLTLITNCFKVQNSDKYVSKNIVDRNHPFYCFFFSNWNLVVFKSYICTESRIFKQRCAFNFTVNDKVNIKIIILKKCNKTKRFKFRTLKSNTF